MFFNKGISPQRSDKNFDFLGYNIDPKGLSIAPKNLANFLDRITQLYEQGAKIQTVGTENRNGIGIGWAIIKV